MFDAITILIKKIRTTFVTKSERRPDISETRDISATQHRDTRLPARQQLRSCGRAADGGQVAPKKLVMESLSCPYCASAKFVKKGFRMKKREKVQLYLCLSCHKVFTPRTTKGKHYPLSIMLDAISIYNLGYSLEQTCKIVRERQQKTRLSADSLTGHGPNVATPDLSNKSVPLNDGFVKRGVDPRGVAPLQPDLTDLERHWPEPTPKPLSQINLHPSTLATWIAETGELCRFSRMREYAIKKFSPKDMVVTATLAHRQLYRYRFHQAKCLLMIREEYQHRTFMPLKEFLAMVPVECPHQYFQDGLRASETPLTFSKTAMIVRGKTNYATRLAAFVLQSVSDRKTRHEAIQRFFLANDSVTVATEVPVYLTRDDIEHMKSQLGFEIYNKEDKRQKTKGKSTNQNLKVESNKNCELKINELPKLITGHIDILQVRNGQIHILDYKPQAEKERPIEQLTLYAMALSRLTGLRLFEFKCAWFDEKDYFEFYPLHVLHKPKKAQRRRKVTTAEGVYAVNKNEKKVENVRPVYI